MPISCSSMPISCSSMPISCIVSHKSMSCDGPPSVPPSSVKLIAWADCATQPYAAVTFVWLPTAEARWVRLLQLIRIIKLQLLRRPHLYGETNIATSFIAFSLSNFCPFCHALHMQLYKYSSSLRDTTGSRQRTVAGKFSCMTAASLEPSLQVLRSN